MKYRIVKVILFDEISEELIGGWYILTKGLSISFLIFQFIVTMENASVPPDIITSNLSIIGVALKSAYYVITE